MATMLGWCLVFVVVKQKKKKQNSTCHLFNLIAKHTMKNITSDSHIYGNAKLGAIDGIIDGIMEGLSLGVLLGILVGDIDGSVGINVGELVGHIPA